MNHLSRKSSAQILRCAVESLESRTLMAFGQLDTTFGTAGHAVTPFTNPTKQPIIQELTVAGGKIVAAGNGGIARYNTDGSPDTAFNSTGKINLPNVVFKGMAVDSAGRVHVLATSSAGTIILRYTAAGTLDTGYATGGTALVTNDKNFSPLAFTIGADDKPVAAGVLLSDGGNTTTGRVYRLTTAGAPDTTFNTTGVLAVPLGSTNLVTPTLQDTVTGVTVLASGKILLAGGSRAYAESFDDPNTGEFFEATYGDTMFAAARINSNGTIDGTYGAGGVSRAVYHSGEFAQLPSASTSLTDGTSVIAVNDDVFKVAEFGAGGAIAFNKSADVFEFGTPVDMTVKSDGRFFILGVNTSRDHGLQMVQMTSAGVFSNVVYTDDTEPSTVDIETSTGAITIAPDGDLLVGGRASQTSPAFELNKHDEGNAAAARPDEFTGARASDIFRDAQGGLHLAYYDASSPGTLKYAYRNPNGLWENTVTVDPNPFAGQYVSVGADKNGNPGIAYFDGVAGDFRFAYKKNGAWTTELVEGKGSVGLYPSLKFDDSGRPTTIYYHKTKGDMRFAVRNMTTGVWGFETVQSADNVGRSGDLGVDPVTNRFACTYVDSTTGQINYALHQKGGTWAISKAASTLGSADYLSLSYTYFGRKPAIAYYDANKADLKLTTMNSSGVGFTTRLLSSKGAVGLFNTLVYDSNGASIYTWDKTNDQVLLVRDNSSGLTVTPIVKGAGKYLSVFSDTSTADMSFYDAVAEVLKVRPAPVVPPT